MQNQTDYAQIVTALANVNAELSAAECHGMFCGVLCANGRLNVEAMAMQVMGSVDKDDLMAQQSVQQISAMLTTTMAQLGGEDLDLQLLLPSDEAALSERTQALSAWCQGFAMGLSAGGVDKDTKLNKDASELLGDFMHISRTLQSDTGFEHEGEEDEIAYAEVQEYVRVGVMLVNEELQSIRPDGQIH